MNLEAASGDTGSSFSAEAAFPLLSSSLLTTAALPGTRVYLGVCSKVADGHPTRAALAASRPLPSAPGVPHHRAQARRAWRSWGPTQMGEACPGPAGPRAPTFAFHLQPGKKEARRATAVGQGVQRAEFGHVLPSSRAGSSDWLGGGGGRVGVKTKRRGHAGPLATGSSDWLGGGGVGGEGREGPGENKACEDRPDPWPRQELVQQDGGPGQGEGHPSPRVSSPAAPVVADRGRGPARTQTCQPRSPLQGQRVCGLRPARPRPPCPLRRSSITTRLEVRAAARRAPRGGRRAQKYLANSQPRPGAPVPRPPAARPSITRAPRGGGALTERRLGAQRCAPAAGAQPGTVSRRPLSLLC